MVSFALGQQRVQEGFMARAGRRVTPAARALAAYAKRAAARGKSYLLPVAGLGCMTAAAFTWMVWAGLVAAGISCFVLDLGRGEKT